MIRRQRGVGLSSDSLQIVKSKLKASGLTQDEWAYRAYTSISTIKRLLREKKITRSILESALEVLGLSLDDLVIKKQMGNTLSDALPPADRPLSEPGVVMTAIFVDTKRPQVERVIRHLQTLLIDSEVIFSDSNDGVSVQGVFEEHNRKQIEMTIAQMERLFTAYTITW